MRALKREQTLISDTDWTQIASDIAAGHSATARGVISNRGLGTARISIAVITASDVPDNAADLPASLDPLIIQTIEIAGGEAEPLGSDVPLPLQENDRLYLKTDTGDVFVTLGIFTEENA